MLPRIPSLCLVIALGHSAMSRSITMHRWLAWLFVCTGMPVWSQTVAAVTIKLTYDHPDHNPLHGSAVTTSAARGTRELADLQLDG
jgi:hypothetical protein